jgi:hypothetical protein
MPGDRETRLVEDVADITAAFIAAAAPRPFGEKADMIAVLRILGAGVNPAELVVRTVLP